MESDIFRECIKNEDPLYGRIRDYEQKVKDQINSFWQRYQNYAPLGFMSKIQQNNCFHQRWWEMFLGVGLLNLSINLTTDQKDCGPDFSFIYKSKKYHVEAIAPKEGSTVQKIPSLFEGVSDLPEDQFLLRLTHAIFEKQKKFNEYLGKGTIQSDVCLIIALSACDLNQFGNLMNYPVMAPLKITNAVGDLSINIEAHNIALTKRKSIKKISGNEINVEIANSKSFNHISGLIYSFTDPLNSPDKPESTFTIYKNNNSLNEMDLDIFKGLGTDKLYSV